jgi:hypothetical protein
MTAYTPTLSEVIKVAQSTITLALADGTMRDQENAIRLSVAALREVNCTSLNLCFAEDSGEARQIIQTWNAIKKDGEHFSFIFKKRAEPPRQQATQPRIILSRSSG